MLRIPTLAGTAGTTAILTLTVTNSQGLSDAATFPLTIQQRSRPLLNFGQQVPVLTGQPGDVVEWQVTVGDVFDPPSALQLRASSLSPALLPDSALTLLGSATTRLLRAAVPQDADEGTARIRLDLSNTAGLSTSDVLELVIELPDGPIINDGEPLPDRTVAPGTPTVVDLPILGPDGSPGVFEVTVFSLDPEVLPNDALRLLGEGEDLQLEIDTSLGQPGTARIVVEARAPDGGLSRTSFQITFAAAITELELSSETVDIQFGDQRFVQIEVRNTGENPAAAVDLRLNASDGIELISTLSRAQDCVIDDDNVVRCQDRIGAGWNCQGGPQARRCQIDELAVDGQAILLLGRSDQSSGSVLIEVEANNANPSNITIESGD